MTGEERDRRDSRALEPELITDPQAKTVAEERKGFRQYDAAIGTIHSALDRGTFKLRPSLILGLQREALAGIGSYAGNYRPGGVAIECSKHEPLVHISFRNSSRICATTSMIIGKTARRFILQLT